MNRTKDITNQKFDRWTAIKKVDNNFCGAAVWLCRCDCGVERKVDGTRLRNKSSRSCGCLRDESASKRSKKNPYWHTYSDITRTSAKRNIQCLLTYEEFLHFTTIDKCHYCGDKITWNKHTVRNSPGGYNLDRIDSGKAYSIDNCVVCCSKCNVMKSYLTVDEFMGHIKKIISYQHHDT